MRTHMVNNGKFAPLNVLSSLHAHYIFVRLYIHIVNYSNSLFSLTSHKMFSLHHPRVCSHCPSPAYVNTAPTQTVPTDRGLL